MIKKLLLVWCVLLLFPGPKAWAQGQDSTPTERDIMVIAEMFPGRYDNSNQNYFDQRRNLPEDLRHGRVYAIVERIDLPAFGDYVFWTEAAISSEDEPYLRRIYTLEVDNTENAIRMKMYIYNGADYTDMTGAHFDSTKLKTLTPSTAPYARGCDVLWRREAGQFSGETVGGACREVLDGVGEARIDLRLILTPDAYWASRLGYDDDGNLVYGYADGSMYELSRVRTFNCYADIPGVAGGYDEPFDRYQIDDLHDMGGLKWFESKEGRTFGVTLRNVEWAVNNEVGAFTRNSLVMYLLERDDDGVKTLTYGWTEPRAERIGINMQWMLVNCYMVSNRDVIPFFGKQLRQ